MAFVPQNTDLPSSWLVPGVYIQLNLNGSGSGLNSATKRILLSGYKAASGTASPDAPVQIVQQSDANAAFGQGSDLARLFAATVSQIGAGTADVFCLPSLEPSSGTASTHLIAFVGTATGSGSVDVFCCGYKTSVAIASGDTPTIIATNVAAALNLVLDLPVTAASSTGTVTLTYRHKGVTGNDLPTIVNMNGSTGVQASPGTITLTGTASAAGSITVTVGGTTITAPLSGTETATQAGDKLVTAIAASANPVTAVNAAGVVTLYYNYGRVVHKVTAASTATGLTVAAAVGTAGAGTPTLTAALSNVAAQQAYRNWATCYNDTTSLGTMSAHIELYANGLYQKDQILHYGSTDSLTTSGAVPVNTTPTLSSSPRYAGIWCVDSPQQAYELAGRTAGLLCIQDYYAKNFDGMALSTSGTVPLMLPAKASRPIPSDNNAAMYSYHITPLVANDQTGTLQIMRGMTTSRGNDQRQWNWSFINTLGYYRFDMNAFLVSRFQGKSLKLTGIPSTPNVTNPASIADAVYERLLSYDQADLFDGADAIKGNIQANPDPLVVGRINVFIPMRPPVDLHQIAGVGGV
jgi:phage tail sheath gpL-like